MDYEEKVKLFADNLKDFFMYFDTVFCAFEDSEQMLDDTLKSLKNKVNQNETALPLIIALGSSYDSTIDKLKIKEIEALIQLRKTRLELGAAVKEENRQKEANKEILSFFGL